MHNYKAIFLDEEQGKGHLMCTSLNCVHCNLCHWIGSNAPHIDGCESIVEEIEVRELVNSHTWIHSRGDGHTPTLHKAFHYRSVHLNHIKKKISCFLELHIG